MAERLPAEPSAALATDAEAALLASLESLRNDGARRLAPVRLRYLDALARRMRTAPDPVRRILQARLQLALADGGEGPGRLPPAPSVDSDQRRIAGDGPAGVRDSTGTPLAQLNRYIRLATGQAGAGAGDAGSGAVEARPELKSAHRFRESWSRIRAEDEVARAVGRGPENAGPLNSHGLVLRSLTLMRELSPDYLRRFLSYADSLLWLDQAQGRLEPPAARPKAARRGRPKK